MVTTAAALLNAMLSLAGPIASAPSRRAGSRWRRAPPTWAVRVPLEGAGADSGDFLATVVLGALAVGHAAQGFLGAQISGVVRRHVFPWVVLSLLVSSVLSGDHRKPACASESH